jgi:signal transduction histidine kinase/AmiR/NasT family two-component response regulator
VTVIRHRVFLGVSLVVVLALALLLGVTLRMSERALDRRFEAWAEERQTASTLLLDQTMRATLMMAEVLAQDRDIHALLRSGRAAVMIEGGGAGGPLAQHHRQQLMERLGPAWRLLTERYDMRQLHFHLGPGDLSFLRVHAPTRFGDRMDDLRPLVVDAIAEGRPIAGFELGRIYAGLRGIAPVFDAPGVARGAAIGAVEVGTSLDPVLSQIAQAAGGDYAVLLDAARVDGALFKQRRAEAGLRLSGCDCVLEAETSDTIRTLTHALPADFLQARAEGALRIRLVETAPGAAPAAEGSRSHIMAAWPLTDHAAATRRSPPPGWIVTWKDVTPILADHRAGLALSAAYALAAFLVLELAIFLAVRQAVRVLERRVETATAELVEASAAKSRFLATMSHEIRTPMNGVLGMAEVMSHEPLTDRQARMLATIRSSGALLMNVISDILDVSKLGAGKMTLEDIPFDLAETARGVLDVQEAAAAKKGLTLALVVDGAGTSRRGDPHRMAQILHNLVGNAIKFSDAGAVTVALDLRAPEGVVVSVADHGVGMTEEQAARVFDAFAQADASTARRSGGTGLGLSIVKGLVEGMGGRVDLDTAPGAGAVFTVRLPLRATEAIRACAREAGETEGLRGLRVLAADDNEVNRMVLAAMLDRLGVDVAMTASGPEALRRFEEDGPFDLVLLDVVMPGMDGPETRRRLAGAAARRGLPPPAVVACTARTTPEAIQALLADGFAGHLAKPLTCDALAETLRRHAPTRRASSRFEGRSSAG